MTVWRDDFDRAEDPGLGGDWVYEPTGQSGLGLTATSPVVSDDGSAAVLSIDATLGGESEMPDSILPGSVLPAGAARWEFVVSGRIRRPSGKANCNLLWQWWPVSGLAWQLNLNTNGLVQQFQQGVLPGELTPDAWYLFAVRVDRANNSEAVKFWLDGDPEPNWTPSPYSLTDGYGMDFSVLDYTTLYIPPVIVGDGTNGIEIDWLQVESLVTSRIFFYEGHA